MVDGENGYNSCEGGGEQGGHLEGKERGGGGAFEYLPDDIGRRLQQTSVNIPSVTSIYIPHCFGNTAAELMNSSVNERVRGSERKGGREGERRESPCEESTPHTEATPPAADLEMSHSTPLD